MIDEKRLGIWVTHAFINLIGFTVDPIKAMTKEALVINPDKVRVFDNSKNTPQNKEKVTTSHYNKKICDNIKEHGEVLIFGDIEAHKLLVAILRIDKEYKHVKIGVEQTENMTEKQQHAFVREYFSRYYHKC